MSKICIVDDKDQIINHVLRDKIKPQQFFRVTALWITNSKQQVLLALRHRNKKNHPHRWGPAVAGTVEGNETYLQNVIKEAQEEIGLKNIVPKTWFKKKYTGEHNYFVQWFVLKTDKALEEIKIQPEEVEQIKWFDWKELKAEIEKNPDKFTPNLIDAFIVNCEKQNTLNEQFTIRLLRNNVR